MNTQPTALRLADCMEELVAIFSFPGTCGEAAAELRRLQALNQELLEALDWIAKRCAAPLIDWPLHNIHREAAHDAGACARAAIAKATGEQK